MDDRLLPRQVPEPTRFPSAIFEPCVPDASLVFGCGLFEAPTAPAEVTKPPQETASTEDLLHSSTRGSAVPSWIKAYGVGKWPGVEARNFERRDRRCVSSEDTERGPDLRVPEVRKSADNWSGVSRAGSPRGGQRTGVATRNNSVPVPEVADACEKLGTADYFLESTGADEFAKRYRYGLEGCKTTNVQTRSEFSVHRSTERQGGISPTLWQGHEDGAGKSGPPAWDLPSDRAAAPAVPTPASQVRDVTECGSSNPGQTDPPDRVAVGATGYVPSDRVPVEATGYVPAAASAPRLARVVELQKKGDKFPEPQKGFISSDCSLSDCTPLDSGRRRGKWKNRPEKDSDRASVSYESTGRVTRERDARAVRTSGTRRSPGRPKRRDAADPSVADFGESSGTRAAVSVSDPLIRALFHLQNRHTELLLRLSADVGEVALKQKRMFDVFQRLQSAFCDGGTRAADDPPPASAGDRGRRCDKCTQTDRDAARAPRAAADASTQSDGPAGGDGGPTPEASRPGGDGALTGEPAGCSVAEPAVAGSDRSESGAAAGGGGGGGGGALRPGDVRRLIGAVRSIAARVEDSGGKERRPHPEAEEGRSEWARQAEVAGLVAAMRGAASRYKNNDFIKAPDLEDVAEASENSSDSEGDEVSETGDESPTIGDLSLVPQNVSLSPDASLRIDPRGLEVSSDALATGSEGSDDEGERSARCPEEKGHRSQNTDMTAIYLYRNIFSKVQEILEHNKTAEETRRESSGNKPSTPEAEKRRTRTRSH